MKSFQDHLVEKNLDRLAERCVRDNIPIVEFVQWYEEEGQYLEGVAGSTLAGAGYGAGIGSMFSPAGAGIGAGIGAAGGLAYGLGKKAYDYFTAPKRNYNTAKQQAIDALKQLAALAPSAGIENIINQLNGIATGSTGGGAKGPKLGTNPDIEAKRAEAKRAAAEKAAEAGKAASLTARAADLKTSLGSFFNDEVINNLAHNGVTPDQFKKAFEANKSLPTEEAYEKTLTDLGIRNRAGGYYKWNPSTNQFEWAR